MDIIEKKFCFICNGIKCHWNFWLLPKDFIAITLFGHVFFNISKDQLRDYLNTNRGRTTINHERIHVLQAETFKTKYLGFYIIYLYYWVKNLFIYGVKDHVAYRNIPFELEASKNDWNLSYNESNWKYYIE